MTIMSKRGTQDNVVTYEHWCDSAADLEKIDPHYITLGSTAVVLDDGQMKMYIADSNKQWKEVSEGSGATASDIKEISAKIEELRGKIQVITEKNPLSEEEVDAKLSDYAKKSEIPTTVAGLSDAAQYAKKTEIPISIFDEDGSVTLNADQLTKLANALQSYLNIGG